jgi:hypothetical protein
MSWKSAKRVMEVVGLSVHNVKAKESKRDSLVGRTSAATAKGQGLPNAESAMEKGKSRSQ